MIDLDAARRERNQPEGLPLRFAGEDFLLPAEFPLDVLDPFLSDDFDLAGLIREAMEEAKNPDGTVKPIASIVVDVLFNRPALPVEVIQAIFGAFETLFGTDEYTRFKALRPSLPDYGALTSGLIEQYGVGLGEAFASLSSSETDGATPNQTSPASTPESTPESSGAAPDSSTASSE